MSIVSLLRPKPLLTDEDVAQGLRMMTREGAVSLALFSVTTSGLLVGFALALGANNLQIGILVALPFVSQIIQLPSFALVERLRWRKAITIASWLPSHLAWALVGLVPVFVGVPSRWAVLLVLLIVALRGVPASVTNTSWNSWVRDLVPSGILGRFFARRLTWGTVAAIAFGLLGAFFVDWWQSRAAPEDRILGYTFVLVAGAALLGLSSIWFLLLTPEPRMQSPVERQPSLWSLLMLPWKDRNFRQLTNFLFFWGFAVNLAVPFFTVMMLQRLGYPISAVIALNILSQLAMVLFLRLWGLLADRFGSKAVLSLGASLYLLTILGWAFTTLPDPHFLTVPLVVVLHVFAGIAAAGVNLATSTIGLKLAPQGQATSYLVLASLATNVGTGLGPLAGGLLADFFATRRFSVTFEWADATGLVQFPAFHLVGFDFLFIIAVLIGLITLNALTTVREEGEVGREVVLEELLAPTRDMARTIGAIPGLRFIGGFPFAYLERIPGLDVVIGLTGYEIASVMRNALIAGHRGREAAGQVEGQVTRAVSQMKGDARQGVGLARHATRGAMHAINGVAANASHLAREAVLGTIYALGKTAEDPWEIFREAGYGTVQGASEIGADVGEAAAQALEGARAAAQRLGLSEAEAVAQASQGALAAAEAIDLETASQVEEALA